MGGSSNTGPLAAFVIMALIWGYNWVVMKLALRYVGPLAFSAWRCALGVLLLFGVLLALRIPLKPRELGKTIWLGLSQNFAFVALVAWALSAGAAGAGCRPRPAAARPDGRWSAPSTCPGMRPAARR